MEGQEDTKGQEAQNKEAQAGQEQSKEAKGQEAGQEAKPKEEPKVPQDIDKFRDKVRMEERTKLQNQLDRAAAVEEANASLKGENEALKARLSDLETKGQQEPPKAGEDAKAKKSTAEKIDQRIEAATTEVAEKLTEKFTSQINAINEKHASETAELRETLRRKDLAEYRMAKVAEAQGQIIEELVTGNTEQEIDDSYARARAVWQKTVDGVKPETSEQGEAGQGQRQGGTPPPAGHGAGRGEFQPGVADADSAMAAKVRSMSDEEFAASRKNLQAELMRRYPNQR